MPRFVLSVTAFSDKNHEMKFIDIDTALSLINTGDRVFIHGGAATPVWMLNMLLAKAPSIRDIELVAISLHGDINWNSPEVLSSFYLNSLFVSDSTRDWVNGDQGEYLPVFLSEIPRLFAKVLPLDVAVVQVSLPDENGYCTLGPSVDVALSAVQNAKKVIAQVNTCMPRVFGDGIVHYSKFDALVLHEEQLAEAKYETGNSEIYRKIGQHIAEIIEDRSTLQVGIGHIPDAVLRCLHNHKNLGIHTEMFSDGLIPLVESGVITNEYKKIDKGKIVSSFILGTQNVYNFANDNPIVNCMQTSYVNDTSIIRKNPKVVAINSAIEIDLTGQVCADSIGTRQYSGIGGQLDFIRGASLSEGGKPIIALPSVTKNGESRIVPFLKQGAGVVTTRGHVHYVATEYGIVNLYGKNMAQRAKLLINIAHPDHRERLERFYHERFVRQKEVQYSDFQHSNLPI
jgi:acyl-CoA hydrolase